MRFDREIFFVRVTPGGYDPDTGDYADDTETLTRRMAAVQDTKTETLQLVYGSLKQGNYTVVLQNHYPDPFDLIQIGNGRYRVDYRRRLRQKDTFIVSEVQ